MGRKEKSEMGEGGIRREEMGMASSYIDGM